MQLNLYVPKEREATVRRLEQAARAAGKPKNLLVLEAVEEYLAKQTAERPRVTLRTWKLGIKPWTREDIYEERINHILGLDEELRVAEDGAEYRAGD